MRSRLIAVFCIVLALGGPALAGQANAPDVVVYADPTMARAMDHLAADFRTRAGVPVRVFRVPSALAVALVRQGARNDVLAIEAATADLARGRNLARAAALTVRDPVVLAASAQSGATDIATAARSLGDGHLATVDPVSPDRLDGPALAQRLAFPAAQVAGQPSGPDAAALLVGGGADLALIERADARRPEVREVAAVPDDLAPARRYAVAVSHNAISPQLDRFLAYLTGPDAATILVADGWEVSK